MSTYIVCTVFIIVYSRQTTQESRIDEISEMNITVITLDLFASTVKVGVDKLFINCNGSQ